MAHSKTPSEPTAIKKFIAEKYWQSCFAPEEIRVLLKKNGFRVVSRQRIYDIVKELRSEYEYKKK